MSRCVMEVDVDKKFLASMSDDQVRSFLQKEACDVMMEAYKNARATSQQLSVASALPRGGEIYIEGKADSKGNAEIKAGVKITF